MASALAMTAHCGGATRSGESCTLPQGFGTGHPGTGRCKHHGGSTPTHERSGAITLAHQRALVMGVPTDVDPIEAILKCIRISHGEVVYASERIAELDPEHAVGPVITTRPLKLEGGESAVQRAEEHGPPAVHIWIEVRRRAMRDLVDFSKAAIAAGIAERQVRVAEGQAVLMATAVRGILSDLGVGDHPNAPAVVRRHLTLLAGVA